MIFHLGRDNDNPARRVVEEPRRSIVPVLAAAFVLVLGIWTFQRQSIENWGASLDKLFSPAERAPGPASGDLRTLFSADDYPTDAQIKGEEGTVRAELIIDPRGRVSNCLIVQSSGHPLLDNATCSILERRARFKPARDLNGHAVGDHVFTPPVVWRLEG